MPTPSAQPSMPALGATQPLLDTELFVLFIAVMFVATITLVVSHAALARRRRG